MLQPDGRRSTEDCWQLSISEHSKINGKEIATVCPLRPNEIKGSLQSLLNLGSSLLFQNQIFSFHMHAKGSRENTAPCNSWGFTMVP